MPLRFGSNRRKSCFLCRANVGHVRAGNYTPLFGGIKTVMRIRQTHNHRLIGWLLTLALFVMAMPSRAILLCPAGTPCAADCPMLRHATASGAPDQAFGAPRCPRCAPATSANHTDLRAAKTLCTTAGCVLKADTRPSTTLAGAFVILLPLLALPPPTVHCFVRFDAPATVSYPSPVCSLSLRSARPHPGRAPPVRLA